ncbi:MAG: glycosyltransferase family 2 protein [Caulobacterales bacterium]|nr:glycosyltransferase family 2 protein [Caulobacterales bacterium]
MTAHITEWLVDNAAWADAQPRLSVLIPFWRDDPARLLAALDREEASTEIVLLDDGSGDEALAQRVAEAVQAARLPVRYVRLSANEGRAKGRNRLTRHARAATFLFLDSDMLPDRGDFLRAWTGLATEGGPMVAFGGFSLDQTPVTREHALHRAMALHSDCTPAAERALQPEKHVFTSNLMVRRAVFETVAFDEGFSGWGWEDVEWAMRVAARWPIAHVDNPASHLGLDRAATIAAKYEQSAANFARVVAAHREVVSSYPSYKVARLLRLVPARGLWRPMIKAVALADLAPIPLRAFSMRLYRAALYAEAVR